ncbi:hypothetical protein BDV06DRAFT_229388 [Aspergillus oleicola]
MDKTKPASDSSRFNDPFGRQPLEPPAIINKADKEVWELNRIIGKRWIQVSQTQKPVLQYLVYWYGYSSDRDEWVRANNIQADEAIKEFKDKQSGLENNNGN